MDNILMYLVIGLGIAIALIIAFFIKRSIEIKKLLQEVELLERKRTVIYGNSITHEFNKLKKMNISETSQEKIEILEASAQEVFKGRIQDLSDILYGIEDDINDNKTTDAKERIEEVKIEIDLLEKKANELSREVKNLVAQEEKAAIMHADLKNKVNKNKELVESKKSLLGENYELFMQRHNEMIPLLEEFLALNIVEDRTRADEIVEYINDEIEKTPNLLFYIPTTFDYITETLEPKLEVITQQVVKMLGQGFKFSDENILDTLQNIRVLIDGIKADLKLFNINDYQEEFNVTIDFLNKMNREIEIELKSDSEIPKKISKIEINVKNAGLKIREYRKKKDAHIRYGVDEKTIAKMDSLDDLYETFVDVVKDLKKAYSDRNCKVSETLLKCQETLTDVIAFNEELKKNQIFLESFVKEEKEILEMLEKQKELFNRSVIAVETSNLPIIPDRYFLIKNETDAKLKEFEIVVSSDDYSLHTLLELLNIVKNLSEKLSYEAVNLVESHKIATNSFIYLNRYIDQQDAQDASAQAKVEYDKGNYTEAGKIIAEYLKTKESSKDDLPR